MKPTVRNIAERANVSIASVSLVLNNKPSRITEATRQKIIEAAKELGYNFEEKKKNEELSIENVCNNFEKKSIIGVIRPRYIMNFWMHARRELMNTARFMVIVLSHVR